PPAPSKPAAVPTGSGAATLAPPQAAPPTPAVAASVVPTTAATAAPTTAAPTAAAPVATLPAPPPQTARRGGLWSGPPNIYPPFPKSGKAASKGDADVGFDMDGPAAAALAGRKEAAPAEAPAPPGLFRLDLGSSTSVGKVRTRNEDSYLVQRL